MKYLALLFSLMSISVFTFAELAEPKGDVILEVSGNIQNTNSDDVAEFDLEMLQQIRSKDIVTSNHVVKGSKTYSGPIFDELIKAVKGKGSVIRIFALDDYVAELQYSDIKKYQVILATHEDGKKMPVKKKGPLFVVFPFDEYPELRQDIYYSQSVWQVKAIEIE